MNEEQFLSQLDSAILGMRTDGFSEEEILKFTDAKKAEFANVQAQREAVNPEVDPWLRPAQQVAETGPQPETTALDLLAELPDETEAVEDEIPEEDDGIGTIEEPQEEETDEEIDDIFNQLDTPELTREQEVQHHNARQEAIANVVTGTTGLGFLASPLANFYSGTLDILAGVPNAVEALEYTALKGAAFTQGLINDVLGTDLADNEDLEDLGYTKEAIEAAYTWDDKLNAASEAADPFKKQYAYDTFTDAALNGDFGGAAEQAIDQTFAAVPSLLAAMSGTGGLAVIGASAFGNKFEEEYEANPEAATWKIFGASAASATFEFLSERVTAGLSNRVAKIAATAGRGSALKTAKTMAKMIASEFGLEGSSEALAEISTMITDAAFLGKKPGPDAWKGILDTFIVGGLLGGGAAGLHGIPPASKAYVNERTKPKDLQNKDKEEKKNLNTLDRAKAQSSNKAEQEIIDETKQTHKDNIINAQTAHNDTLENLNTDEIVGLAQANSEADKLTKAAESETLPTEAKNIMKRNAEKATEQAEAIYEIPEVYENLKAEITEKNQPHLNKIEDLKAQQKELNKSDEGFQQKFDKLGRGIRNEARKITQNNEVLNNFRPQGAPNQFLQNIQDIKSSESTDKQNEINAEIGKAYKNASPNNKSRLLTELYDTNSGFIADKVNKYFTRRKQGTDFQGAITKADIRAGIKSKWARQLETYDPTQKTKLFTHLNQGIDGFLHTMMTEQDVTVSSKREDVKKDLETYKGTKSIKTRGTGGDQVVEALTESIGDENIQEDFDDPDANAAYELRDEVTPLMKQYTAKALELSHEQIQGIKDGLVQAIEANDFTPIALGKEKRTLDSLAKHVKAPIKKHLDDLWGGQRNAEANVDYIVDNANQIFATMSEWAKRPKEFEGLFTEGTPDPTVLAEFFGDPTRGKNRRAKLKDAIIENLVDQYLDDAVQLSGKNLLGLPQDFNAQTYKPWLDTNNPKAVATHMANVIGEAWGGEANVLVSKEAIQEIVGPHGLQADEFSGIQFEGSNGQPVIAINPDKTQADTALHEFGHVWLQNLRVTDPALYDKASELIQDSTYWEDVINDEYYSQNDFDSKIEEALAEGIGKKGTELFIEKTQAGQWDSFVNNLMNKIKDWFGINKVPTADMTLQDFFEIATVDIVMGNKLAGEILGESTGFAAQKYDVNEQQTKDIDDLVDHFDDLISEGNLDGIPDLAYIEELMETYESLEDLDLDTIDSVSRSIQERLEDGGFQAQRASKLTSYQEKSLAGIEQYYNEVYYPKVQEFKRPWDRRKRAGEDVNSPEMLELNSSFKAARKAYQAFINKYDLGPKITAGRSLKSMREILDGTYEKRGSNKTHGVSNVKRGSKKIVEGVAEKAAAVDAVKKIIANNPTAGLIGPAEFVTKYGEQIGYKDVADAFKAGRKAMLADPTYGPYYTYMKETAAQHAVDKLSVTDTGKGYINSMESYYEGLPQAFKYLKENGIAEKYGLEIPSEFTVIHETKSRAGKGPIRRLTVNQKDVEGKKTAATDIIKFFGELDADTRRALAYQMSIPSGKTIRRRNEKEGKGYLSGNDSINAQKRRFLTDVALLSAAVGNVKLDKSTIQGIIQDIEQGVGGHATVKLDDGSFTLEPLQMNSIYNRICDFYDKEQGVKPTGRFDAAKGDVYATVGALKNKKRDDIARRNESAKAKQELLLETVNSLANSNINEESKKRMLFILSGGMKSLIRAAAPIRYYHKDIAIAPSTYEHVLPKGSFVGHLWEAAKANDKAAIKGVIDNYIVTNLDNFHDELLGNNLQEEDTYLAFDPKKPYFTTATGKQIPSSMLRYMSERVFINPFDIYSYETGESLAQELGLDKEPGLEEKFKALSPKGVSAFNAQRAGRPTDDKLFGEKAGPGRPNIEDLILDKNPGESIYRSKAMSLYFKAQQAKPTVASRELIDKYLKEAQEFKKNRIIEPTTKRDSGLPIGTAGREAQIQERLSDIQLEVGQESDLGKLGKLFDEKKQLNLELGKLNQEFKLDKTLVEARAAHGLEQLAKLKEYQRLAKEQQIAERKQELDQYGEAQPGIADAKGYKEGGNKVFATGKSAPRTRDTDNFLAPELANSSRYRHKTSETAESTLDRINKAALLAEPTTFEIEANQMVHGNSGKATVFDFDDTLARTDSKVYYKLPKQRKERSLRAADFAKFAELLTEKGAEFDFREFNDIIDGKPGPLLDFAKKMVDMQGSSDVYVLTARPQNAAGPIQEFLGSMGVHLPIENITGLADGTPDAKAKWVFDKVNTGYEEVYFADDHAPNVKAVVKAVKFQGRPVLGEVAGSNITFKAQRSVIDQGLMERKIFALRSELRKWGSFGDSGFNNKEIGRNYWTPTFGKEWKGAQEVKELYSSIRGRVLEGRKGNKDQTFYTELSNDLNKLTDYLRDGEIQNRIDQYSKLKEDYNNLVSSQQLTDVEFRQTFNNIDGIKVSGGNGDYFVEATKGLWDNTLVNLGLRDTPLVRMQNAVSAILKQYPSLENARLVNGDLMKFNGKLYDKVNFKAQKSKADPDKVIREAISKKADEVISDSAKIEKGNIDANQAQAQAKSKKGFVNNLLKGRLFDAAADLLSPSSNKDFYGLIHDMLPKGANRAKTEDWLKNTLVNPLENANFEFINKREEFIEGWSKLKSDYGFTDKFMNTPSGIKVGQVDLTKGQVARIWNHLKDPALHKQMKKAGINNAVVDSMVEFMESNSDFRDFTDSIPSLFHSQVDYMNSKLPVDKKTKEPFLKKRTFELSKMTDQTKALLNKVYPDGIPSDIEYTPFTAEGDISLSETDMFAGNNYDTYSVMSKHLMERKGGGTYIFHGKDVGNDIKYYAGNGGPLRTAAFLEFAKNASDVFDRKNINKAKAAYGETWVDSMKDSLQRIVTGQNKRANIGKTEQLVQRWLNSSVAAVMFFNTRSAILQLISTGNFMLENPLGYMKAMGSLGTAKGRKEMKDAWDSIQDSAWYKQRKRGKSELSFDEIFGQERSSWAGKKLQDLQRFGYKLTKAGDAGAILLGGTPFVAAEMAAGKTEEEAIKAFIAKAEESQQSARPERLGKEQTSTFGRMVLAFANTPMQYNRKMAREFRNLAGRNQSIDQMASSAAKIAYYGVVQNMIFTAAQQAILNFGFDLDEEEDDKMKQGLNSMLDTILRGSGIIGAGVSTLKNIGLAIAKDKGSEGVLRAFINTMPAVGSKANHLLKASGQKKFYESTDNDLTDYIDNEWTSRIGSGINFATGVPADRVVTLIGNASDAMDNDLETYQRLLRVLGWSRYSLLGKEDSATESYTDILDDLLGGSNEVDDIFKELENLSD